MTSRQHHNKSNSKEPYFTTKSLVMLESKEGQLNAIFACYGSAAQHGQIFEAALSNFLFAYNSLVKKRLSIDDLKLVKSKLHKMTMGALLTELQKHITIDATWVSNCLRVALEKRNFLIHSYFLEREAKFRTEAGRLEMLRELVSIEKAIEKATDITNGMRIALCEALELDESQTDSDDSQTLFSITIDLHKDE